MKQGIDYIGVTVVYFCHDGNSNILMARRSANCRDEQGRWDIGGGAIEFGHTAEYTLRKEILEEYCTDVISYEFLGYRDVLRGTGKERTHWLALDFKVLVERQKVRIGEPHKFDSIGWFTRDTMPEHVHSQFPKFLEQHKEKLK